MNIAVDNICPATFINIQLITRLGGKLPDDFIRS